MNEARRVALRSYESRRLMTVAYQGPLGQGKATETVLMTFNAPASKQFTVLSTSGSQLIRENVFQRAMNAEQTASGDSAQRASALDLDNYTMRLLGREELPAGDSYVLEVAPKIWSEFTFISKVWVKAFDFAVLRIRGKPAVNPSPWISDVEFITDFHKVGDLYFPEGPSPPAIFRWDCMRNSLSSTIHFTSCRRFLFAQWVASRVKRTN